MARRNLLVWFSTSVRTSRKGWPSLQINSSQPFRVQGPSLSLSMRGMANSMQSDQSAGSSELGVPNVPAAWRPELPRPDAPLQYEPIFAYGSNVTPEMDPHDRLNQAIKDGATFPECCKLVDGMHADGARIRPEIWDSLLMVFGDYVRAKKSVQKKGGAGKGFPMPYAPWRAAKVSWILDRMVQASWRADDNFLIEVMNLALEVGDTRTAYMTATQLRVRQRGEAMFHLSRILKAAAQNGDSTTAVQVVEDFEHRGFILNVSQLRYALEACLGAGTFARHGSAMVEFTPRIAAIPGVCRLLETLYSHHHRLLARAPHPADPAAGSAGELGQGKMASAAALARLPDILDTCLRIFRRLAVRHHYQAPVSTGLRRLFRSVLSADLDRFAERRAEQERAEGGGGAEVYFKNALVSAVRAAVTADERELAVGMLRKTTQAVGATHRHQTRAMYKTVLRSQLRMGDVEGARESTGLLGAAGLENDVPLLCAGVHFASQFRQREVAEELMEAARRAMAAVPAEKRQRQVTWRRPKQMGEKEEASESGAEGGESEEDVDTPENILQYAEAALQELQAQQERAALP